MPKGTHAPTSALSREISRVLSEKLDKLGATKKGAARDTGISRTMIVDMLAGHKHWTIDYLDKMCAYLELNLEEVIRNAEKATDGRELPKPFRNNITALPVRGSSYDDEVNVDGLDMAAHDEPLSTEPDSV